MISSAGKGGCSCFRIIYHILLASKFDFIEGQVGDFHKPTPLRQERTSHAHEIEVLDRAMFQKSY